jgi:hypothetical protein
MFYTHIFTLLKRTPIPSSPQAPAPEHGVVFHKEDLPNPTLVRDRHWCSLLHRAPCQQLVGHAQSGHTYAQPAAGTEPLQRVMFHNANRPNPTLVRGNHSEFPPSPRALPIRMSSVFFEHILARRRRRTQNNDCISQQKT